MDVPGTAFPVAQLSPASLERRQNFIHLLFVVMIVGGLALSAVPRATYGTGSSISTTTVGGATTRVEKFSFSRDFGVPFRTARTHFADAGHLDRFEISGGGVIGIVGNMLAVAAVVLGVSLLRRRRRPD